MIPNPVRWGLPVLVVALISVGFASSDSAGAGGPHPVVLDQGHIDLFELTYAAPDGLRLSVKDDTGLYHPGPAYHRPEDVLVVVDPDLARFEIPDDLPEDFSFLGSAGDTIHLLEEVQQDGLPWPGWSTERLNDSLPDGMEVPFDTGVEFEIEVSGPGAVHAFVGDGTGGVQHHWIDSTDGLPDVIETGGSVHAHTTWAFSDLGTYQLTATPRATTTKGETLLGPASTYEVLVGESPIVVGDPPVLSIVGPDGSAGGGTHPLGSEVRLRVDEPEPPPDVTYEWFEFLANGGPGGSSSWVRLAGDVPDLEVEATGPRLVYAVAREAGSRRITAMPLYLLEIAGGSGFTAVDPVRLLDTRNNTGLTGRFGPAQTRTLQIAGTTTIPPDATSVVVNLTSTGSTNASHATLWPTGTPRPTTSTLNWTPGQTVANLAIVELGTNGTISLRNHNGTTHLIADIVGYHH